MPVSTALTPLPPRRACCASGRVRRVVLCAALAEGEHAIEQALLNLVLNAPNPNEPAHFIEFWNATLASPPQAEPLTSLT